MTSPALLRALFAHQAWADAELLHAVAAHPDAAADQKLTGILNHIVFVQRIFDAMVKGVAFDREAEAQPPATLAALFARFAATRGEQLPYVDALDEAALDRPVANPWIPDLTGTVADILLHVALHSQNHRGQCLTRLREIAGQAPTLDFILWVKLGRPAPRAAESGCA